MHIDVIISDYKIGVMHGGLPWAGTGLAGKAVKVSETPSTKDLLLVLLDNLLVF